MNLLGRLLIVLIFVGSIMLMSFSVVLYATHTNWRERAVKLEEDLKKQTAELAELQKLKEAMETALQLEIKRQLDRGVALTEKVRQLTLENKESGQKIAQLKKDLALQVAAVKASHESMERLRVRYDGASKALFDAQNDWVEMATELAKKIDEAHSLALQVTTYQTVSSQLAQDYRDAVEVLRKHGLAADPDLYMGQPPAGIHGLVTEVRPKGIIEISIGSDSGLIRGHRLDVVRNREGRGSYIGKIEITETASDRAVARVLPEFRRGTVQRDDEVQYININELTAH